MSLKDLDKINSQQFYQFWKNLSTSLLLMMAMIAISRILPFYLSPVVAIVVTAILYAMLYNNKEKEQFNCMIVPYAFFYSLILYSFISIIINVLWMWNILIPPSFPHELIFFNNPFIPSLYVCPCCFISTLIVYLRRNSIKLCMNCKTNKGSYFDHAKSEAIFSYEAHFQLKNLAIMFGVLTVVVWSYYLLIYNNIAVNARDWYIFLWFVIIFFVIDEVYFIFRYYNLYLDLKENNEIISSDELQDMTTKTYLRYYVCCGDKMYINEHTIDPSFPFKELIDTPFVNSQSVNGISVNEIRTIIERNTGVKDGELRFFYGRKVNTTFKQNILRYFYFLEGEPEDHPHLATEGKWMDFSKIKQIYSHNPGKMTHLFRSDLSRLATIVLTEKIFNEEGFRKNKLKSYNPTFNLRDVRESELDFQDDKWIKISMFNSDTSFYRLKKWWRGLRTFKSKGAI